jgi:2-polyprenyl-6-methoxyphenol hydroxylase-like FAD-dependent oxidoreductase
LRSGPPSVNIGRVGLDLIIVGAGPAGISTAVEAREAGIERDRILVLEKSPAHSYAIRKYYPDDKRVDAVYKGIPAISEGRITLQDGTKRQTLDSLAESHRALGAKRSTTRASTTSASWRAAVRRRLCSLPGGARGFKVDLSYRRPDISRMHQIDLADMNGMQQAGRLDLLMPTDIERLESDRGRVAAMRVICRDYLNCPIPPPPPRT